MTKSLSNMIKAYSVRYDDDSKKTIDTHFRIDKELEEKRNVVVQTQEPPSDEFVEGLQALVIETLPSGEEVSEKTSKILEDAKIEANEILDKAKKDAEQIKNEAFSAAQKKGYDEGLVQTKREAQKLQAEYEEKTRKLQKEYEDMAASLEPMMAQIIADLVEKMTGVIVEDKEEVILYLINKSIKNLDMSDYYTIRISAEDYEYVSLRKDTLLATLGRDVSINIIQDAGMNKNQCLIETETRIINCSLDNQLTNLITDLKLISSI